MIRRIMIIVRIFTIKNKLPSVALTAVQTNMSIVSFVTIVSK